MQRHLLQDKKDLGQDLLCFFDLFTIFGHDPLVGGFSPSEKY
jgi:hypothetical protein